MKKTVIVAIWLACSVFSRGYLIGGLTSKFPDQKNDVEATMFSLAGPFVLPEGIYYWASGAPYMRHGYTCQQRWEAFSQSSQVLGKRYFVHEMGNMDCRSWAGGELQ